MLSESQLRQFADQGLLVVPDVLGAADLDHVVAHYESRWTGPRSASSIQAH